MPKIINTLTKTSPSDNFPVVNDIDLGGGFRVVSGLPELSGIVSSQLKVGMLVFVQTTSNYYKLETGNIWTNLGNNLGGSGNVSYTDFLSLSGQIIATNNSVSSLSGTLNSSGQMLLVNDAYLQSQINTLSGSLNTTNSNIATSGQTLQSQIDAVSSSLVSSVATLSSNQTYLQSEIDLLSGYIVNISGSISSSNYASGNFVINSGNLIISGTPGVNGVVFADGSVQYTANNFTSGSVLAYSTSFTSGTWTLLGNDYKIDLNHNLNSNFTIVQIVDSSNGDFIELEKRRISPNVIRILVPDTVPDLRFDGDVLITAKP